MEGMSTCILSLISFISAERVIVLDLSCAISNFSWFFFIRAIWACSNMGIGSMHIAANAHSQSKSMLALGWLSVFKNQPVHVP